jgi:hypothetical protein
MTVTPEGTPATDETTPPDSTSETPETSQTEAPKAKGPGAEAAKYRVRAREAETALTAAQARIQAFQTREVERLAAELAQPADLFGVGGVSLADLLTEDGEDVDPDAVADAVADLLEQRPGLAKRPNVGAFDPSQSLGNGGRGKPPLNWNDLLQRS